MSEWKEYNITEVCDTISDTYRDGAEKVVLINTSDVLEGVVTNHEFVPNKNLAGQFKKTFQKDDILYSEIRPANKRYAYVDFEPQNYIASTKLMVLRSKPCILPKYLYYLLTNNTTIRNLHTIAVGRSGTFPQITYSELANIKFKLPSVDEQKEILSTLLDYDDKIAVNKKICENLEAQAQALFKHWFVDFAPFKDGKFIDSELGLIPEGWRVGTLKDILKDIETGKRPKGGAQVDGIPSIGAEKIEKISYYNFSSEKYISTDYFENMTKGKIKSGDVLLYKDGAYTGKSTLFMDDFPYSKCAVNEHVFLLRTENSKWQCWLYLLLSYEPIRKYIHTLASSKAAQPGLNQVELQSVATLIPPSIVLNDFESIINPLFTSIIQNLKENQRLSTLRDTLLPKLMSGEIKV
jgi:type I restriction enzyme S subunit